MSNRKPHNDAAGYVCELKSRHPKLPGHFVILDHTRAPDIDCEDRWIVFHVDGDRWGCFITFPSQRSARSMMKHMAQGGDDGDFGQHESPY